jgi:hypothetical protein
MLLRNFLLLPLLMFISITSVQSQACDFISDNINLGGDAHNNGFQENFLRNTAASLSNDNFVVVWETRDGVDGDSTGAFFQVFTQDGVAVTDVSFPYVDINPLGTGAQGTFGPLVVALNDGFVMGWESLNGPGDTGDQEQDVYFRVYGNDGSAITGTTRISIDGEEDHIEYILPLNTGGFVIVTRIEESQQIPDEPANNNKDDLFFQAFNASGEPTSGAPQNISSGVHDESFQNLNDSFQSVVDLGNGNFVIAWEGRDDIDGEGNGAFFRVYNINGSAITGVIMPYSDINAAGTGDQGRFGPKVDVLAGGNFVMSWESRNGPGDIGMGGNSDQDVYFRVYSPSGMPVSGTIKANSDNTSEEDNLNAIIPLTNGNFAILYRTDVSSGNTDDLFVRVFDASGSAVSSSTEVSGGLHVNLLCFIDNDGHRFAALNNDGFVIGWSTSNSPGDSGTEGYYRIFNGMGIPTSEVVRPYADINPSGTGNQANGGPNLKTLPGGFAVVWPSEQGPGDVGPGNNDDQDVYHRVVDNDGMPLCGTTKTNAGNDAQEEIFEQVEPLQNGSFIVVYKDDEDLPDFNNKDDYFVRVIGGIAAPDICPALGSIIGPDVICTGEAFSLTVNGLENMAMADNDQQDYGITFVAFTTSTDNPYANGTSLGSVPFGDLTNDGTTATLDNIFSNFPEGPLFIYAILTELPEDEDCRPFAEVEIVNSVTPMATFTAPDDIVVDAGVQSGLSGGLPVGGVYSGPGVTDDGNGMTYSFDPAAAGVGTHTITYSVASDQGCMSSASDDVMVNDVDICPALGSIIGPDVICTGEAFSLTVNGLENMAMADNDQQDYGITFVAFTPSTDNPYANGTSLGSVPFGDLTNDGTTATLDNIFSNFPEGPLFIYAILTELPEDEDCRPFAEVEIANSVTPMATFTAPADIVVDAGVQSGLSGGLPVGGVYSGPGVTDDGNGMTYSFDPAAAGVGTHTITYSVASDQGCMSSASDDVMVNAVDLPGEICAEPVDINTLFGQTPLVAQVSDSQDNTGYSTDPSDPTSGFECHFDSDPLQHTIWYTFMGDGNNYLIRSIVCNDSPTNLDLQAVVYSGSCQDLTATICNEDEDGANNVFNISFELNTEEGTTYLLMIDGYSGTTGAYCLEVTNLTTVGVTDLSAVDLQVYPNPTTGNIQLPQMDFEQVEVYDASGRLISRLQPTVNYIDISSQSSGVYYLKLYTETKVYSAKVVKD